MRMSSLVRWAGLAVVAVATVSCGDVVRSNDASVMLVFNSLTAGGANTLVSDVITGGNVFNEQAVAALAVIMKDISISPSSNNGVTINRYRVEYRRADGHNTPGVDVPYPFDGTVTLTIPAGGTGTVTFELVRHVAKEESPLIQLRNNPNIISTIANVTFFGADQVGNDVSATGTMQINFGNVGS